MSKQPIHSLLVSALVLTVVAAGALPAMAMPQHDDQPQTRIHIERKGGGEGEETVSSHKMIFVGEDGEVQEVEGEGIDFSWIDGEDGRRVRMRMPRFALRDGAFLGVSTTQMTPELRTHFGVPEDAGVMISQIVDDSAAFSAGLLVGDIITAVDGEPVESSMDLLHAIRGHEEGDSVTIEIWRDGKVQDVSAVLGKTEHRGPAFEGLPHRMRGFPHGMKIDCEEGGGDCEIFMQRHLSLCGEAEECEVKISCEEGECSCTVNGEEADCEELHGIHMMPDD